MGILFKKQLTTVFKNGFDQFPTLYKFPNGDRNWAERLFALQPNWWYPRQGDASLGMWANADEDDFPQTVLF